MQHLLTVLFKNAKFTAKLVNITHGNSF